MTSESIIENGGLSATQQRLFLALFEKGDVGITELYKAAIGLLDMDHAEVRQQQQLLGAHITKMNRRLKRYRLKAGPGATKRTYALHTI